jgi:predicted RNA-binding Zn ribbon-like protein
MLAPFIGGHPAIDFLNTSFAPEGTVIETLDDGRALLDWLVAAQLLDSAASAKLVRKLGTKALDGAAADARKLRDSARAWLVRWAKKPAADYEPDIEALNKLLAGASFHHELKQQGNEFSVIERPEIEDARSLLALLAMQIAQLLTNEQPALIKTCAGNRCSLWFLDRTKAHRRIFCSASACGNRAKVAAFRQRQKE